MDALLLGDSEDVLPSKVIGDRMAAEQTGIFALFGAVFIFLVWGRVRYDLVAFSALIIGVIAGLVPVKEAFSGFGNSAVIIIALVLIVSRGLINSGAVEFLARYLVTGDRPIPAHIGIMAIIGASLSAVINNVAALALLMPLDIEAAEKAKRAIGLTLMPLSFATILGGMITMIGTPPNILIAQYRQDTFGTPFSMLDFAPVGSIVALCGVVYVALIGWRFLPNRAGADALLGDVKSDLYVAELQVSVGSKSDGTTLGDLYPLAEVQDLNLLGLIRHGRRLPGFARQEPIAAGDFLIVEGDPKAIEAFMGKADLKFAGADVHEGGLTGGSLNLMEAIVPDSARIAGRSALALRLLDRESITLLGVARQGQRFRDRVRQLVIEPGDVLLMLGSPERLDSAAASIGVFPLEGRRTGLVQRKKAGLAIGLFLGAIGVAVAGLISLPIALAVCVAGYTGLGLVGGREVYEAVEWKVIVLLACLIPLGVAFETTGSAELMAGWIVSLTKGVPPWAVLLALMVVTMTLSDFLNNVATTLIAAPIAVGIAQSLGVNPDPFLMGVAVAASCAFLTPIGHKNNTIIMGPGGYHFGDYWRIGLPLEALVLAVGVPAILLVWPL